MIRAMPRMTRGRLCELSRGATGRRFYHLQYRKDTKLFQKYVPVGEVAAYEEATERFREFMRAVDDYVDDMSRLGMEEIAREAAAARGQRGKEGGRGRARHGATQANKDGRA